MSKRTNSLANNNQQIGNNDLKSVYKSKPLNEENDDPHPNIINATELNLNLLPRKLKNVNNSRPKIDKNERVATKSYDRSKAKEHIAEQQRKRLLEKKAAKNISSEVEKDEIKKRLATLHQNSLKIVKKNLSKKRKDMSTMVTVKVDEDTHGLNLPTTSVNKATTPRKIGTGTRLEALTEATAELAIDATPSKRGILRRNELFDGPPLKSHSPPRLDQTIVNSLLQTVKQRQSVSDKHESSGENIATPPRIDDEMKLRVPQSEKSRTLSRNSSKSRSKSWDLTRSSTNKRPGSTRLRTESKHNIPFWLKPTSVQMYPYNFIMAVRKKLESVTQPTLVDPLPRSDTPLARPKDSRKLHPSKFRHNLDNQPEESIVANESTKAFLDMIDSIPTMKSISEEQKGSEEPDVKTKDHDVLRSKPISVSDEFSTNFSSISLNITDRNTISELSSIHSEQPNHPISSSKILHRSDIVSDGDDTTISSAILSQNSPDRTIIACLAI